jgi:hypothetical protein
VTGGVAGGGEAAADALESKTGDHFDEVWRIKWREEGEDGEEAERLKVVDAFSVVAVWTGQLSGAPPFHPYPPPYGVSDRCDDTGRRALQYPRPLPLSSHPINPVNINPLSAGYRATNPLAPLDAFIKNCYPTSPTQLHPIHSIPT